MGRALAEQRPECRAVFDEADAALGFPLSRLCFEGPDEELRLTENTQPAILTVSVAAARLLQASGIQPDLAAGHSLGEYSAHVIAGTLAFPDAVRIVRQRGRYMQEAVPVGEGAMAAVLGLDAARVERACAEAAGEGLVSPANFNAPGQVVIAGTREAVARAGERARSLGAKRIIPLSVSAPFHCALMQPAQERLEPELRALTIADPAIPVFANVDGAQVSAPVRWDALVRRLASAGVRAYVEVGPGAVLSGLVRKIDRDARVANLETPEQLDSVVALAVEARRSSSGVSST
jgi:[acyl-carrier-protein] S-malonyltransferase